MGLAIPHISWKGWKSANYSVLFSNKEILSPPLWIEKIGINWDSIRETFCPYGMHHFCCGIFKKWDLPVENIGTDLKTPFPADHYWKLIIYFQTWNKGFFFGPICLVIKFFRSVSFNKEFG